LRWEIIKDRFFESEKKELNLDERITEAPLLIIDGIILNLKSDTNKLNEISRLLTNEKNKELGILDKEPEGLYVNKAFSGIILVTLTDKKTSKKFRKLNKK
jgi:hypothetical protein